MAGAFDHALHAVFEAALGKRAEGHDFFPLGGVARVASRAGAQAVAERQGHVVLAGQFEQAVIPCQQRVFLVVLEHPAGEDRTAARHDAKGALAACGPLGPAPGQAAMQGHEVHALLRLHFDFGEQFFGIDVGGIAILVDVALRHRVQRHRAEWQRRAREHILADRHEIAGNGQIHDRIGSGLLCDFKLAHFAAGVILERRGPDVGVDLHPARLPDENGLDVGVIGVAEQDHGPGFDGRSDGFRRQSLVLGQRGQMRGEQALKGRILSDDGH